MTKEHAEGRGQRSRRGGAWGGAGAPWVYHVGGTVVERFRTMSISLHYAEQIAEDVIGQLAPHCEPGRCVVAGSVRRKKPRPNDIEIVCIPQRRAVQELFGQSWVRSPEFQAVVDQWERIKGDDKYIGRMLQVTDEDTPEEGPEEGGLIPVQLDIFCATPDNWGMQLAVRTGSAEFAHKVLATGWVKRGYHSVNGMLWKNGQAHEVREERDLFRMAGVAWVEPERRG